MKILFLLILLTWTFLTGFSQYNGGSGDGYGASESVFKYLDGESPIINPPEVTEFFLCGKGEAIITLTPGTGGDIVKWYEGQIGGSAIYSGNTFTTAYLESSRSYWVSTFNSSNLLESSRAEQIITVSIADAGINQVLSETEISVALSANNPTGSGYWIVNEGSGTFMDNSDPYTEVVNINTIFNTFSWNLDGCDQGESWDSVFISRIPDYNIYNGGSGDGYGASESIFKYLDGESPIINPPEVTEFFLCGKGEAIITLTPGTGGDIVKWYEGQTGGSAIYSGNTFTTAYLESSRSYWVSTFNSSNLLESSRAEQIITVSIADAGINQVLSETEISVALSANNPTGSGYWNVNEGSGTFMDNSDPYTEVVSMSTLFNTFKWTLNGCDQGESWDTVNIVRIPEYSIYGGGIEDGFASGLMSQKSLNGLICNPPTVITQDITVTLDESGIINIMPEDIDNGSTSDCGIKSLSLSQSSFTCENLGENIVTLTVVDISGNEASEIAIVRITDNSPPVISSPAPEIVECDVLTDPSNTGMASATDNCDAAPVVSWVDVVTQGACPNKSVITRIWTATDEAGNSASASQTITIEDNTPPSLVGPADLTIECNTNSNPEATGYATATDNCDAEPVVEYSDEVVPGACPNVWTINRIWTAADACGNSASMVQVITIIDTQTPIMAVPADKTIECDMDSSPDATGYATAADNCDAAPVITYTDEQVAGSCANEYTITRTWTATDACGNVATAVQVISVNDVTIPVIAGVPTTPIIQSHDAGFCGAFIDYPEITATDNCSNTVNLTLNPESGSFFPVGTTAVKVTAEDDCGNTETVYFDVEITNEDPVIESLTAPIDPIQLNVIVNITAEFTDNNLSDAVWDWGDGTSSAGVIDGQIITGDHLYEIPGVYILTLTITDMCGETDTEMYRYVVIYDPNDGFVTGGGWINSPPGAYTDDPLLEGKANFGFVSKYKKGKDIPEGNTEFQFNAGDLKFKSTSYYWLVIAGAKAKFKGDGTVNNVGDYGFMISAIDGDLKDNGEDRFRIKIWDITDETVIYDNEIEADENEDPTTQLGGGSIVIHVPKTKGSSVFNDELEPLENEVDNTPTMLIYPNPAKDNINIVVSGKEEQTIQLKVFNSTGQLIYISSGKGTINEEISLEDNKSGLYSVIAIINNKLIIQKVLIE